MEKYDQSVKSDLARMTEKSDGLKKQMLGKL